MTALEEVQGVQSEKLSLAEKVVGKAIEALKSSFYMLRFFPAHCATLRIKCLLHTLLSCSGIFSRAHPYKKPLYEVYNRENF